MRRIGGIDPAWGITAVRVAMAIILINSGYRKVAWGAATLTESFTKMRIAMPDIAGQLIAYLELIGGVLLLIGLFGRWMGLLYTIEFTVATFYVKFMQQGFAQGRLELMLLAGGILLFLGGPGKAAVDAMWTEKA